MNTMKCKSLGCDRDAVAQGYCSKHYNRRRRAGLLKLIRPQSHKTLPEKRYCKCGKWSDRLSKGMCRNCYQKHRYKTNKEFRSKRIASWRKYAEKRYVERIKKKIGWKENVV